MVDFTTLPFTGLKPKSDDIPEGTTNLYFTAAERAALAALDPNAQLPAGGTTTQRLEKIDGTDFNAQWADDPVIDVGLTAFNGRTVADVVPTAGDYIAAQITYDPSGSTLTSLTSQTAIDELAVRTDASTINGHVIQNAGVDETQEDRLDFTTSYLTVVNDPGVATRVGFDPSGLLDKATYDPTAIGGDAFDLSNHIGNLTLSRISDSGALAAKDLIDETALLAANVVTTAAIAPTGAVANTYQWPTIQSNTKGQILTIAENVDPLARANHTGTQLIATISDAAAIAASGSAEDLSDGVSKVAMTLTERNTLALLDPNAQLPLGGVLSEVLTKNSATNYDASWQPAPGGAGGHVIQDATTTFPQRTFLKLLGDVVVNDNGPMDTTEATYTGGGVADVMVKAVYDTNDDTIVDKSAGQFAVAVNRSGASIPRGSLVTFVQWDAPEDKAEIALADKDTPGSDAAGMTFETIADDATGLVLVDGAIDSINTTGTIALQVIYLGNAGAVTYTEPVSGAVQPVGFVVKPADVAGRIVIDSPLAARELAEVFLVARDAQLAGDMDINGFNINVQSAVDGPVRGKLWGSGNTVRLESTGTNNLALLANEDITMTATEVLTIEGDVITMDSQAQPLELNTSTELDTQIGANFFVLSDSNRIEHRGKVAFTSEIRVIRGDDVNATDGKFTAYEAGGTVAVSVGSFGSALERGLRFNGNGVISNEGFTQTVAVNNIVFRSESGSDVLRMPIADGSGGDVVTSDGAGNLALLPPAGGLPTETVVTFGTPNTAWDLNAAPAALLTLTGNTTLDATNIVNGRQYNITFVQDGVGGHSVTLGSGFVGIGVTIQTFAGAAGRTSYEFYGNNGTLTQTRDTLLDEYIVRDLVSAERGRLHWNNTFPGVELLGTSAPLLIFGNDAVRVESQDVLTMRTLGADNVEIFSGGGGAAEVQINAANDDSVQLGRDLRMEPTNDRVVYQPSGNRHTNLLLRSSSNGNPVWDARIQVIRGVGSNGWTMEAVDGATNLLAEGDAAIASTTNTDAIDVNNYRFTKAATTDTFVMPVVDIPGGGVFSSDGAGIVTLETGVPSVPGDPRIGNFSSVANAVTINLSNIEVAYVQCDQDTITVNFSNGVNGKAYAILFIDNVGPLTLIGGGTVNFGTDITDFPSFGAINERHWFTVICYEPSEDYDIVAFSRGY